MYALIALFFPSVLGVKFLDCLIGDLSKKRLIYYFSELVMFSTICNTLFTYMIFNIKSDIVFHLNTYPILFIKYIFISIIFNAILALLISLISKNVSISLEEKNDKKNNKKRNNN